MNRGRLDHADDARIGIGNVIRAAREHFDLPIAAYNVSGEYSMVKACGRPLDFHR